MTHYNLSRISGLALFLAVVLCPPSPSCHYDECTTSSSSSSFLPSSSTTMMFAMAQQNSETHEVLILGNSLSWGLHEVLQPVTGMTEAYRTPPGERISGHARELVTNARQNKPNKLQLTEKFVVLQGQSIIPSCSCIGGYSQSRLGVGTIRQAMPENADLILMMTWGRREADGLDINNCYSETQDNLRKGYEDFRDANLQYGRIFIAPVGMAFKYIRDHELCGGGNTVPATCQNPGVNDGLSTGCESVEGSFFSKLFAKDGYHNGNKSKYLIACVLYATMTGKSPKGKPFPANQIKDAQEAERLANAAEQVVLNDFYNLGYDYPWQTTQTTPPRPTPEPTRDPATPTVPTPQPTQQPNNRPTQKPPERPPSEDPRAPSDRPRTPTPTKQPTRSPTNQPTQKPTRSPTPQPTRKPTQQPTNKPTPQPTRKPTPQPTNKPTNEPTAKPTKEPTPMPSPQPTAKPTTKDEQPVQTERPTVRPTPDPTAKPTEAPTRVPTRDPTSNPTNAPTRTSTRDPSASPSSTPSTHPSDGPSSSPSTTPSSPPSDFPTTAPSLITGEDGVIVELAELPDDFCGTSSVDDVVTEKNVFVRDRKRPECSALPDPSNEFASVGTYKNGQWFRLIGNGHRMQLSIDCSSSVGFVEEMEYTMTSDINISLFQGLSCDSLQCMSSVVVPQRSCNARDPDDSVDDVNFRRLMSSYRYLQPVDSVEISYTTSNIPLIRFDTEPMARYNVFVPTVMVKGNGTDIEQVAIVTIAVTDLEAPRPTPSPTPMQSDLSDADTPSDATSSAPPKVSQLSVIEMCIYSVASMTLVTLISAFW